MERIDADRRYLITGATSGIGEALAYMQAQRGRRLWLTYAHRAERAEQVVRECRQLGAAEVRVSHLDLRQPASIAALVEEVQSTWSRLHVLINNGAVCLYRRLEDITQDEWDLTLETNVRGPFLLTRGLSPLLRETAKTGDDANIVNVASVAGQIGAVSTSIDYAASKGALLAMTRSFARALSADRVRVNAVTPGPVESAITDQLGDDARAVLESGVPLGRFGTPAEVAWVIAALADPSAGFVTGATYDVNGGVRID